eukprot:SAG25_NODE_2337_length_1702_cov_1.232689_5_plen_57_part_01
MAACWASPMATRFQMAVARRSVPHCRTAALPQPPPSLPNVHAVVVLRGACCHGITC